MNDETNNTTPDMQEGAAPAPEAAPAAEGTEAQPAQENAPAEGAEAPSEESAA